MDALVTTIVGIVASVVIAYFFYWIGKRTSRAEKLELLDELSALRNLMANVTEQVRTGIDPARHLGRVSAATEAATTEVIISAALGALVDERGEIAVSRLTREVSRALARPSGRDIEAALLRMREEGAVTWDGPPDSVEGVRRIRVVAGRRANVSSGGAVEEDRG